MLLNKKKGVRTGSRGRKRNRKTSGFLQNTNNLKYTNKPSVVQKKLPKKNVVFIESRELFSFTNPVKVKIRRLVMRNLNYLVEKKVRVATLRIELGFLRNKINRKHFFHSLKIFFITPKFVHAFFSLFKFFFTDGKLVLLKRPPTTYVHIFSFDNFSKVIYDRVAIHKYFWLYITFSLSKIFPISIRGVKNFKITIGTLATRFIKRWKEWGRGSFFYKRLQRRKFRSKSKFLNLPKFATEINYLSKPFPRIPKNFFGINGIKNLSFFKKFVNKLYLFSLFSGKINFKVLFSYMKLFRKLLKLNFSTLQFFTFFKSLLYFSALSRTSIGLIRFFFFIDFYIKRAFSSMETIISPFIPMFAYNCTVLKKFSVAVQKAIFLRKPYTKYYKHDDDEKFMVFRQAFFKKKSALNFWFPRFNLKKGFFNKSFNLYSYLLADFVSFCFDKLKAENLLINLLNTYEVNWTMKKIFHKRKPITVLSIVRRKKQRMRRTFKFLLETMKSKEPTQSFLSRLPLEGSQVFSNNFTELSSIFLNRLYNLKRINVNTFYLTLSTLGPSQRRRSSIKWQ